MSNAINQPTIRLHDLPVDVLTQVMSRTSGGTVLRLATLTKSFRAVAHEDTVWKELSRRGLWSPTADVLPIISAGAYRDAYQVQVMEKKVACDKLLDAAHTLQKAAQRLSGRVHGPRRAAILVPLPTLRAQVALLQRVEGLHAQRETLMSDLFVDHLGISNKGWRRQWG